jgi:hypothetical protein
MVDASRADTNAAERRQPGQPPSGASDGISAPHFGQSLGALIIAGESLTRSLFFYCVKSYQRLRSDHSNSIAKLPRLPFGRLWYGEPNAISNAIGYAKHRSRSHDAVIRVYDEAGNVIETHEHVGDLKE